MILVETTINAPVEKVWTKWTNPTDISQWNHASDEWHTPLVEIDLRIGSTFLYRMEAKDGSVGFDFIGTFSNITEERLIEYVLEDRRRVRITFLDLGNGTTHLKEEFDPENIHLIELQRVGWQAILDNFKKYVEQEADIKNCVLDDVSSILSLYEAARSLQMQRQTVVWPSFDSSFIEKEIHENRQWKLLLGDVIACNWAITFEDKEIWEEKDKNDAIYIHRICTNPNLRGRRYIDHIVAWAKDYARQLGKPYIRLDTLGNNTRLIEHYTSAGFDFLGMFLLTNTATLPKHYQDESNCCLFELKIE